MPKPIINKLSFQEIRLNELLNNHYFTQIGIIHIIFAII
jgi:hypothetical protein